LTSIAQEKLDVFEIARKGTAQQALEIIKTDANSVKIEMSARSMDNEDLKNIKFETIKILQSYNFNITTNGKYPAWKPDINEFTSKVLEIYKEVNPNASLEAIHAGLECAIFKDKYPHIKIASIGPTIDFPHSKKEQVSIKSIENNVFIIDSVPAKYYAYLIVQKNLRSRVYYGYTEELNLNELKSDKKGGRDYWVRGLRDFDRIRRRR